MFWSYCLFLSWELVDDPSQSSLCNCCQSTCKSRSKRGLTWGIPPLPLASFTLFLRLSLYKMNHSILFRFPKLQSQICPGTPDHRGSIRGPRLCAGHWSGVILLWFRWLELICDSNIDRTSQPELRHNGEPVADGLGSQLCMILWLKRILVQIWIAAQMNLMKTSFSCSYFSL